MSAEVRSRHDAYCVEGEHEVLVLSKGSREPMDPLMLSCDSCGTDCCESHWDDHECPTCRTCDAKVQWVPETKDRCDDCHEGRAKAAAREEALADLEEAGDRKRAEWKDEDWGREAS